MDEDENSRPAMANQSFDLRYKIELSHVLKQYRKRKAIPDTISPPDWKRAKLSQTLQCFGCGNFGHRIADCQIREKNKNFNNEQYNITKSCSAFQSAIIAQSIKCFRCGVEGHIAKHCTAAASFNKGLETFNNCKSREQINQCTLKHSFHTKHNDEFGNSGQQTRDGNRQATSNTMNNWRRRNDRQTDGQNREDVTRTGFPRARNGDRRDRARNNGFGNQRNHSQNRDVPQRHQERHPSDASQGLPNRQNQNDRQIRPRGRPQDRYRMMGFLILEQIAKLSNQDIFIKLNEHKEGFMNMINSPIRSPDIYTLIFQVLSKVSQSPFDELKSKLLLDVCNSGFISSLRNYLIDLPYTDNKIQNKMYWEHQNDFWKNFIVFCSDIVNVSPSTAVKTCRALIENISKTCMESLTQNHGLELSDEDILKMDEIRMRLITYAEGKKSGDQQSVSENFQDMKPPENFRELSVIPTREDMLNSQPFLRPNIINGGYSDVDHYLDVQFRLLREDCFGPLRVGINQYLGDSTKRKYDNVRVYRNVKFAGPYISNVKVGYLVQIDIENSKHFTKINWAHSKRFLFGSLVVFTKDNFNNVLVATILDRDVKLLATGKLAVTIINAGSGANIHDGDTYTMIESEVYYEPYYHVLKALQASSFPEHLAMQQYIVNVTPASDKPSYLNNDTVYILSNRPELAESDEELGMLEEENPNTLRETRIISNSFIARQITFCVMKPESWPTKEELNFNQSQYEAYRLALTHEFAVIQGPPGTGKTYVGLNVAKTLLQNVKSDNSCLMLVICYTNHALDQFLEEISKVTKQIIRIGGQSRNPAIEKFNLSNLRKEQRLHMSKLGCLFTETREKLRQSIKEFQEALLLLDILEHGVINYRAFDSIPQFKLLCTYYNRFPSVEDPLMHWLFENADEYYSGFKNCVAKYAEFNINSEDNEFNNMRADYNIMLEKFDDKHLENSKKMNAAFTLIDTQLQIKALVTEYMEDSNKKFKDRMQLQREIQHLNSMINLFKDMRKFRSREVHLNINENTDFLKFVPQIRWRLYFTWIKDVVNQAKSDIERFQTNVSPVASAYEETRMMMDLELLKNKKIKVLGLTTSGAARMRKLLQAIAPKIVIVEEAAEVLEQHIITSLTKDCEHLILIGDHQQLRPSASYMKLAKHYNIEISLFERMITNGIHSRRLKVQHRMRPEIAALISPHIYPDLENHPTVENFGNVLGLEKNIFFFSHEYPEEAHVGDLASRANHKEADMTLALANYIMQQGYTSDDLTILAAYSGQMFYMRKERNKYASLREVKITVVDNYQGEESKIILLSLVRNNVENNIGFLGTENRICVALSRAKQGFYMFGNINMLKAKSELWTKIAGTLESNNSVGTILNLKCQIHPDQITPVTTPEDFDKVPEGGCFRKCEYQYSCGHFCQLYCHGYDRQHEQLNCNMKCERVLCDLGHVCPLKCFEDCGECKVYVKKTLPCSHEMNVFCHREPDDPNNQCLTKIQVTLPNCGHKAEKSCYMDINQVKCTERCKQRLEDCGHACERLCHVAYPGHSEYLCMKNCGRAKKGCKAELDGDLGEHQCKKLCYEGCNMCNVQILKKRSSCKHVERVACCVNVDDIPCKKKCTRALTCGHFCKNKCSEQCGDCKIIVTKEIPDCNHKIKVQCMVQVNRAFCKEKCERTLSCGHKCKSRCQVACDAALCEELTTIEVQSPCGHKVKLPCNLHASYVKGNLKPNELLKYCTNPCGAELACKHLCRGTCSQCRQGRLHVPCKQICNQTNICGHQCQEPCNQICPPCNMICEVQCQHSHCSRMCGEPCVPCKEKCSRQCRHGACTRVCAAACSRGPCGEACARALACGHRCRGLCGEPCPDVCRVCRPEQFPTDFLGDEYGEEEKFILLQDCGHVMELENMDNLMMGDQENIKIRQCPFCRKPIINTNRYKDLVNNMFKNEINPIKERVYGNNHQIEQKMQELKNRVAVVSSKCYRGTNLRNTIIEFQKCIKSQKKMYLLLVEMLLIYCNIMEMITECWRAFKNTNTITLNEEFEQNIEIILQVLKIDSKSKVPIKISEQQQKDIGNEIKRLNTIAQLAKVLEEAKPTASVPKVKDAIEAAKIAVFSVLVFNEDEALESVKNLQTIIKSSCSISKMEREMIVRAVGVKAGAWYKCPNGHFYCIGECGGANQIGKCPECGEQIGGSQHRLLSSNAHAPEMDGSRFAAFSNEANNMRNFIL